MIIESMDEGFLLFIRAIKRENKKPRIFPRLFYMAAFPSTESNGLGKADFVSLFCLAEGELLTLTESQKYNPPG